MIFFVSVTGAALPRNYLYIAVGIVFGIVFVLMMLCLALVCKRSYVRTKWRQSYEEKSVYNSTIAESHNVNITNVHIQSNLCQWLPFYKGRWSIMSTDLAHLRKKYAF